MGDVLADMQDKRKNRKKTATKRKRRSNRSGTTSLTFPTTEEEMWRYSRIDELD